MRKTLRHLVLGCALVSALAFGCKDPVVPEEEPEPEPTSSIEYSENTRVLTEDELAKIESVNGNIMIFSDSVPYSVGDILFCGISPATPKGFLGEVTEEWLDKIFYTKQSTLEDAIVNGKVTLQKRLSGNDARSLSPSDFNLNIDVYDTEANASIRGNISFDSDLTFELDIENAHIKRLLFKNEITEECRLELIALSSVGNLVDEEFSIFKCDIPPIPIPSSPIVITPKLEILTGIKGNVSLVTQEVTQTMNSTFGLEYKNSSWRIIDEFTNSYEFSPVEFAEELNVKAYVGPKMNFLVNGLAGPYGKVNAYLNLKLSTDLDWLELYGGLEAILGVNMEIFGRTLIDFSTDVLDYNELLARLGRPEEPEPEPEPELPGKILFSSDRADSITTDYSYEIYTMNSNGTEVTRLTNSLRYDGFASWSPDRTKIVFVSKRDGNEEIYTMNADGSNQTRLTNNSDWYNRDDSFPRFSPDGQEIVFLSNRDQYQTVADKVWIMNADGSNQHPFEVPLGHPSTPDWSPDGNRIIFASDINQAGDYDIYLINKDGTGLEQLTNIPSLDDDSPHFSPDGQKIVFSSFDSNKDNWEIYTMNADGSNQTRLTDNSYDDGFPTWSSDKSKIAFISRKDEYLHVYTMNADGSNIRQLTSGYFQDNFPSWY